MRKWVLSIIVFILTFIPVAGLGVFLGLLLVGPHSDIIKDPFRVPIGAGLWVCAIGIPLWMSWKMYFYAREKEKT